MFSGIKICIGGDFLPQKIMAGLAFFQIPTLSIHPKVARFLHSCMMFFAPQMHLQVSKKK